MFSSAMNYLAGAASSVAGGANPAAGAQVGELLGGIVQDDPLVGSVVEVGEMRVLIKKRIGEGGFAFVYLAEDMSDRSRRYALKRLLAMDTEKRQQIIQEISILKGLSDHENVVTFVTAATVDATTRAASKCDEFLVLMEFCPHNLADIIRKRPMPYPPETVAKIFTQVVHSVSALHNSKPPIIHRDLKLENLLIDDEGKKLKLCDFGSATTRTYQPTSDWSIGQRNNLEEEMARHTTPMYRAPEMLDMWSNYPIDTAADVWALGCILFFLCFHQHPFEDSAKLAIINGNYRIPFGDFTYSIFHDLIKQMLVVDPSCRPTCNQILEHINSVSIDHGIDLSVDIDFELSIPGPIYDTMAPQQESSPNHKPNLPAQPAAPAGTLGLMSSLRGGAGHIMRSIKETSKTVIQSVSVAGRGLDFHCITERVAAMSYPSDGFESAIRHHIDDVSSAVENCHANHYAIINLTERRYNSAKFHSGVVIDAGWKTSGPTSLTTVFETADKCMQFLQKDTQNVIVIHCLDGRTNTALLVSVILMSCKFVNNYNDAIKFFELKRCVPILENYHKSMLKYIEKCFVDRQLVSRNVTLTSLVLEPVPLFNKQGDGCKPFVQIVRGDEIVTSPGTDFAGLQQFTTYDEDAVLKLNVKLTGDVFLAAFHARQTFGGLFSKMDGVPMLKLYFHTGFVAPNTSCLKFKLRELDGISSPERYGPEFKAVVNFRMDKDSAAQSRAVSSEYDLGLIFNSKSDFELNRSMMFGNTPSPQSQSPSPPLAPPRTHKTAVPPVPPKPELSRTPSPIEAKNQIADDFLIEPSFDLPTPKPSQPPKLPPKPFLDIQTSSLTRPASDTLLLDLGFNGGQTVSQTSAAASNPSIDILLDFGSSGNSKSSNDPFFKPAEPVKPARSPTADLFGNSSGQSIPHSSSGGDLFGDSLLNLGSGIPNPAPTKPVLSPVNAFQKPLSVGDELLSNLLGDLDMNSSKPASNQSQTNQQQQQTRKPNYSSTFFQSSQPNKPKGKLSEDTFNDLLGGFSAGNGGSGGSRTIGEMKKKEEIKYMDPNEALVFKWKDGKSRNLRALLCSLDTIIWKDSRWTQCGMHQLITPVDVKKMYKKACLAVHPDKQSGTEREELAKLIFMELNDAWSEFEKQQEQLVM